MKRENLTNEQIDEALKLLDEATPCFADMETAPNGTWIKRYFLLDGAHMILTDDGWESGESKAAYQAYSENEDVPLSDVILDEVNAPK